MDLEAAFGAGSEAVHADILALSAEEIRQRTAMLNNNCRVIRSDLNSVENEIKCVRWFTARRQRVLVRERAR